MNHQEQRWAFAALITVLLAIGGTPSRALADDQPYDSKITQAVERRLINDTSHSYHNIDASTSNGIVTLTGNTENLLTSERAVRIAQNVRGVRAVVNRIQMEPARRTDSDIAGDVRQALLMDPVTDSYEITAASNEGVVTLDGTVQSYQEQQLAGTLTKGIDGVKEIKNNIKINYKATQSDGEIEKSVESRLAWDLRTNDALIDVQVEDGKVTLTGSVGSAAEKERARLLAWTMGVKSVDAEKLKVEAWRRDEMRRKGGMRASDADIKQAVKNAFFYDPRVYSFNPNISVRYGVVTLTGTVDNAKAKSAAEDDARNTVGVWNVRNYIRVWPKAVNSEQLVENVERALLFDPWVDRWQVIVSGSNGTVYLDGTVDSFYERARAEDVASRVNGVGTVYNYIDVEPPDSTWLKSDWEIERDINQQMTWSPFVDANEVNVSVEDGVATITGTVQDWSERHAAAQNAIDGGALAVRNHLWVEGGIDWLF
jgi:osmotically-inducible protein OsmY